MTYMGCGEPAELADAELVEIIRRRRKGDEADIWECTIHFAGHCELSENHDGHPHAMEVSAIHEDIAYLRWQPDGARTLEFVTEDERCDWRPDEHEICFLWQGHPGDHYPASVKYPGGAGEEPAA